MDGAPFPIKGMSIEDAAGTVLHAAKTACTSDGGACNTKARIVLLTALHDLCGDDAEGAMYGHLAAHARCNPFSYNDLTYELDEARRHLERLFEEAEDFASEAGHD